MRIDKLHIQNYRGFKEVTFQLNPHFNVFIGDNGAGKTSVLDACKIMMSGFLQGINKYARYSIDDKSIRRVLLEGQARPQLPAVIRASGFVNNQLVEWIRKLGVPSLIPGYPIRDNIEALKTIVEKMVKESRQTGKVSFPLLAYHGTGRLWVTVKDVAFFPNEGEGIVNAYANCLSPGSNSEAFLSWYKTYEDEVTKFNRERDKVFFKAFKDAITAFVPQWTDMAYSHMKGDLIGLYKDENGQQHELAYSQLSDGFRNAIGMVADIAYRCIQLNPHLGSEVIRETEGIVLIDEIDLHLHPNWQRRIVADLKKVFPKIQFIATTHSPFIIQSLQKDELFNLDEVVTEEEPFKQSIEDIAESIMQVEEVPRSKQFNEMLDVAAQYYNLLESGAQKDDADLLQLRKQLSVLEERYSNDPAFVALLRAERQL